MVAMGFADWILTGLCLAMSAASGGRFRVGRVLLRRRPSAYDSRCTLTRNRSRSGMSCSSMARLIASSLFRAVTVKGRRSAVRFNW